MWSKLQDGWPIQCVAQDATRFITQERGCKVVLEFLRGAPAALERVVMYEIDADIMRELGRFRTLKYLSVVKCTGTLPPLPPSLTYLAVSGGELDHFLPIIAQSNVTELRIGLPRVVDRTGGVLFLS